jgi:hypothetical protein
MGRIDTSHFGHGGHLQPNITLHTTILRNVSTTLVKVPPSLLPAAHHAAWAPYVSRPRVSGANMLPKPRTFHMRESYNEIY